MKMSKQKDLFWLLFFCLIRQFDQSEESLNMTDLWLDSNQRCFSYVDCVSGQFELISCFVS